MDGCRLLKTIRADSACRHVTRVDGHGGSQKENIIAAAAQAGASSYDGKTVHRSDSGRSSTKSLRNWSCEDAMMMQPSIKPAGEGSAGRHHCAHRWSDPNAARRPA